MRMMCPACGRKISHYHIDGSVIIYHPCGCNLSNTAENRVLEKDDGPEVIDEVLHYFEYTEDTNDDNMVFLNVRPDIGFYKIGRGGEWKESSPSFVGGPVTYLPQITIDPINPSYYERLIYKPIDVASDWFSEETGEMAYVLSTVLKYLARFRNKNGIEDLEKARWFLDRAIKNMEDENEEEKS